MDFSKLILDNQREQQTMNSQKEIIKEESKELGKAMGYVYNSIILNCQKKCLSFK